LRAGILLFLLGLLGGFMLPLMENSRMGLSSHLEGVMNGTFLVVLGLAWGRLSLGAAVQKVLFAVVVYGTYANWLATQLAGFWGAGTTMMPIAGGEMAGSALQEGLIVFALVSLSVGMIVACLITLWGLRGGKA
jgi:hydroxylaminobenzene mutase